MTDVKDAAVVLFSGGQDSTTCLFWAKKQFKPETLCVQAGWTPKKGEPRVLPIYQSTTFKYDTSEQMARLFDLEDSGYFYTRLQNPTNDAVAAKIAALEGGVAAMLTSSGQAANFYAIFNIKFWEMRFRNNLFLRKLLAWGINLVYGLCFVALWGLLAQLLLAISFKIPSDSMELFRSNPSLFHDNGRGQLRVQSPTEIPFLSRVDLTGRGKVTNLIQGMHPSVGSPRCK
jgi:hypothetical protein